MRLQELNHGARPTPKQGQNKGSVKGYPELGLYELNEALFPESLHHAVPAFVVYIA